MSDLASVTEISEAVGSWSARIGSVKVEHGPGCLAQLGELVAELKGHRAMIVTDPGIRAAGHVDRALQAFKGKSIEALGRVLRPSSSMASRRTPPPSM